MLMNQKGKVRDYTDVEKIGLQTHLPGLYLARQSIDEEIQRIRLLCGMETERAETQPPSPELALTTIAPEEKPKRDPAVAQKTGDARWGRRSTYAEQIVDWAKHHSGVVVMQELSRAKGYGKRQNGGLFGAMAKLTAAGHLRKTHPGVYALTAKGQNGTPPSLQREDWKEHLSRIAIERWEKMTTAQRKSRKKKLEAGRARARAAKAEAARQAAKQQVNGREQGREA